MKHSKAVKIGGILIGLVLLLIIICNVIVVTAGAGKCYDDLDAIPHNTYGLLLGTGRGSNPSPYYDARVQAAIDLYHAGKIDAVIVSGENLYDDYFEVDTMVTAMKEADVPVQLIDPYGTDTYTSLRRIKALDDYKDCSITIISQHFHNQRAIFYCKYLYGDMPVAAYNAKDTDIWYWDIWRFIRELLARTKAVLAMLFHLRE